MRADSMTPIPGRLVVKNGSKMCPREGWDIPNPLAALLWFAFCRGNSRNEKSRFGVVWLLQDGQLDRG